MAVNNLNTPGVGIQPSLIDAKGDLLVGTANDAIDRLGVTGTTGAVLTADAGETTGLKWAAAGSVGGLVHINTTSFSGAVAFSLPDNTFTSTYDNYRIVWNDIRLASSFGNLLLRVRGGGTDNNSSIYGTAGLIEVIFTSNSQTYIAQRSQSSFILGAINSNTDQNRSGYIDLYSPNLAKKTMLFGQSSFIDNASYLENWNYSGQHSTETAFDSATIFSSAGTNIAGTISVYGYRKS